MPKVIYIPQSDEELRTVLALLYNESIKLLDRTLAPITRALEGGDVVYAVWADSGAPGGIDALLLKGNKLLHEMLGVERRNPNVEVVPCQSYEHATEIKEMFGEREFDA